ncbi:hypothetical protein D3C75_1380720 [compost metagenome]
MHFTQTLAEHGGKAGQVLQGIGVAFLHRVCGLQFVTNGALKVVLGPVPGIALVA